MTAKKEIKKAEEVKDDFAEVPEEVLDAEDLKEIAEMKKEPVEVVISAKKKPWEKDQLKPIESWSPKTKLGEEVKSGKIKDIDEILQSGRKILEAEISDYLLPLKSDLISIGQSKGKFGGGKRRAWRQTQRKTEEGNVPTFSAMAIVGDEKGHIGYGYGNSMETLPARDKSLRKAKLNIIKVQRGCASFNCDCKELHTVPFKVTGKSGSVRITLIPAPQGTGLVAANELKKVLKLAGIKDVYTKTSGKVRTTFNAIKACFDALEKTNKTMEEKEE